MRGVHTAASARLKSRGWPVKLSWLRASQIAQAGRLWVSAHFGVRSLPRSSVQPVPLTRPPAIKERSLLLEGPLRRAPLFVLRLVQLVVVRLVVRLVVRFNVLVRGD
jgi:hypothetical protein